MERTITPQDWMYRASAFELLSLPLLTPTQSLAQAVASGEYAQACKETFHLVAPDDPRVEEACALVAEPVADDEQEALHRLRREYTRLFVGEKEPPITPYAGVRSAQRQGKKALLFVGEESLAIERFMHRCGVTKNLAAGQANDPLDHIGTMAEFLKLLCLVNAQAVQAPEGSHIEAADFDEFASSHFAPYALWCAEELAAQTRLPFYRGIALLLAATTSAVVPATVA